MVRQTPSDRVKLNKQLRQTLPSAISGSDSGSEASDPDVSMVQTVTDVNVNIMKDECRQQKDI